ncbi:4Fe-4S dicluster domain-containing protein [Neobacillus massiliamazoniensis]|jgi:formate dehydrogenase iron-sulfur subunit|uniref:4Fe-4S ferredoxin iron-sulfur-binding domain-containing protein n=1 Tax=Neobacillus massiliamazoniensis TaxID=1499688 RepID=A0A0U1NX17_9BACI|nr:4Fe-4S dicluster domain-containing protein [Neobacillus massiliamazoniensis]CRK82571.1 4Fe-4S ferredoxin iron-sulfur-binding domain-containing protein [Neobacillus massiliamazoniensis]
MTEYVKYVDVTKCDGCRACMVACKNWNDLPAENTEFLGSVQSHKKVTADTWNVLQYIEHENGKGNLEYLFRHSSCFHCHDAACEKVCPEDAISHTKYGSVVIDHDKCIGCGYCVQNCPFEVISLKEYKDKNGSTYRKSQKCTLCTDRLDEGLQPACVTTCHTGTMEFGDKTAMINKAEQRVREIKSRFPNAQVYNPSGVGGTNTIYVLAEKPSVYGLPESPKVPTSAVAWKDYAQPIGKLMLGATTMAVVGAFVTNRLFNKAGKGETQDGGGSHE